MLTKRPGNIRKTVRQKISCEKTHCPLPPSEDIREEDLKRHGGEQ
jgi:hypothetical protein